MDDFSVGRRRLSLCLLILLAAAVPSGCAGDQERPPTTLLDGSRARAVSVELEGIAGPAILTAVFVVDVAEVEAGSSSADCLDYPSASAPAAGLVVARVGVSSESVTYRTNGRRGLDGCDNSAGPREENRRWCGGAYGTLYGGRLRDPRLTIGCTTKDGKPMGFVWVQTSPTTRYVVVAQPGYAEVYRAAGDLPVRVATTSGVEIEGSRATFDLSEHDAKGRLLRKYRLEAAVAG